MCRIPGPKVGQPGTGPVTFDDFLSFAVWDGPGEDPQVELQDDDIEFFSEVNQIVASNSASETATSGVLAAGTVVKSEPQQQQVLVPQLAQDAVPMQPFHPYQLPPQQLAPPFTTAFAAPVGGLFPAMPVMPGMYQMVMPQQAALQPEQPSFDAGTDVQSDGLGDLSYDGEGRARRSKKTPEELAAQVERVKKRRRESAQRSRARKNCYVHNLEAENRALKLENESLRAMLRQIETAGMAGQGFHTFAPGAPTAALGRRESGSDHNTGVSETLSPAAVS